MSHDALNSNERANLLAMAGLSEELVEAVEHSTPTVVAEAVIEADTSDDNGEIDLDAVVARMVAKSAGNKDKAMALIDDYIDNRDHGLFAKVKVSKVQGATRGVDSSEHNKAAWKRMQLIREQLKTKARAEFAASGGFVKAKVKASKKKANPELDAFMLQHQDSEVLRQFLALQEA